LEKEVRRERRERIKAGPQGSETRREKKRVTQPRLASANVNSGHDTEPESTTPRDRMRDLRFASIGVTPAFAVKGYGVARAAVAGRRADDG
jgi:hypothetical protein